MAQIPIIGVILLVGAVLAGLVFAGWRKTQRRIARRNLASVLSGEIVAVLRAIEVENSDQPVVASGDTAEARLPHLALPHFTIYEANAGRLDCFAPPLPQKISFFFDRLGALTLECDTTRQHALSDTASGTARARHLSDIQNDLKVTLDTADEILLALRPLASPHTQAKHLI